MTTQSIAAEVRAIVARSGKRHSEVAKRLGLSQSRFSRRLSGAIPFTAAEVARMSSILGVPVSEFFPTSTVDAASPAVSTGDSSVNAA